MSLSNGETVQFLTVSDRVVWFNGTKRAFTQLVIRRPDWADTDTERFAASLTEICSLALGAATAMSESDSWLAGLVKIRPDLVLTVDNSSRFLFIKVNSAESHEFANDNGACVAKPAEDG